MRKRLPLSGVYNTRPGTGALTGSFAIAGIAVAGVAIAGFTGSGSDKDHKNLNCHQITETDPIAGTKRLYLVNRPGFAASTTPRAGHVGNAIMVWTGQGTGTKVMSCFGNTNFKLFDGTTDKGDGTGKATGLTESSISGTATVCVTSTDSEGWFYQDGGSLTNISDGDFPGNASRTLAGTFAHLDGYALVMDITGRIYNSDLNSITAWTAASYITANSVPDVGVACVRHRSTIVGFCKTHFDVFRNAGNPAFTPLARVEEMSQLFGLVNADSVTSLQDIIYFIGSDDSGGLGLYAYDGGKPVRLSSPEVDAALAIAGPSNISITKEGYYGRHFIYVTASSSTFTYCIEEKTWDEASGVQLWFKSDGVVSGSSTVNYSISSKSTSGKVYVFNPANVVYQDDGVTITTRIQTAKWDGGTSQRKFMPSLDVIGDQQSSSELMISWSDDDYQTFNTPRTVDRSLVRQHLDRCGSFRRRAFLMTHSSNTPLRLEAIEPDLEVGSG